MGAVETGGLGTQRDFQHEAAVLMPADGTQRGGQRAEGGGGASERTGSNWEH